MAGLLIQPEGLLRCRSISSALVAVENKPGDGHCHQNVPFYCKSILDFQETHVCSLVYKFALFSLTAYRSYISYDFLPCRGEMAMRIQACLDLVPGLDFLRSGLLLLAVYGKDGQPHGVVPKVSQETLEEMIGDRHALAFQVFQYRFRKVGFIKDNGSPDQHFSFKRRSLRVSQAAAQNDNFECGASTCAGEGQFIEVGVSGT